MLMGISEVSKEGLFELKADPRVLYMTMMLIRISIIIDFPSESLKALLIAFRYGSVRR